MCSLPSSFLYWYLREFFCILAFQNNGFRLYHAFCEIDNYRERKNSVLNGLIVTKVAQWLEENVVPGKIENSLSIPLIDRVPIRWPWQRISVDSNMVNFHLLSSSDIIPFQSNSSSTAVIESA